MLFIIKGCSSIQFTAPEAPDYWIVGPEGLELSDERGKRVDGISHRSCEKRQTQAVLSSAPVLVADGT